MHALIEDFLTYLRTERGHRTHAPSNFGIEILAAGDRRNPETASLPTPDLNSCFVFASGTKRGKV